MTNTIAVVIMVSRLLGQVTLATSLRTCCMNWNGSVFAMAQFLKARENLRAPSNLLLKQSRTGAQEASVQNGNTH
jgi:hypothetical protein